MKVDSHGQIVLNENDLVDMYMRDPDKTFKYAFIDFEIKFNPVLELNNVPHLVQYRPPRITIEEFDRRNQSDWKMPEEYKKLDIAQWIIDRCVNDQELERVGMELIEFQKRDMFMLLRYLKYLVDTMRKHGIVWGVGRGSSVSSFVLYLIGVHKINSLEYDLSIKEFLK